MSFWTKMAVVALHADLLVHATMPSCSEVKDIYVANSCCGNPTREVAPECAATMRLLESVDNATGITTVQSKFQNSWTSCIETFTHCPAGHTSDMENFLRNEFETYTNGDADSTAILGSKSHQQYPYMDIITHHDGKDFRLKSSKTIELETTLGAELLYPMGKDPLFGFLTQLQMTNPDTRRKTGINFHDPVSKYMPMFDKDVINAKTLKKVEYTYGLQASQQSVTTREFTYADANANGWLSKDATSNNVMCTLPGQSPVVFKSDASYVNKPLDQIPINLGAIYTVEAAMADTDYVVDSSVYNADTLLYGVGNDMSDPTTSSLFARSGHDRYLNDATYCLTMVAEQGTQVPNFVAGVDYFRHIVQFKISPLTRSMTVRDAAGQLTGYWGFQANTPRSQNIYSETWKSLAVYAVLHKESVHYVTETHLGQTRWEHHIGSRHFFNAQTDYAFLLMYADSPTLGQPGTAYTPGCGPAIIGNVITLIEDGVRFGTRPWFPRLPNGKPDFATRYTANRRASTSMQHVFEKYLGTPLGIDPQDVRMGYTHPTIHASARARMVPIVDTQFMSSFSGFLNAAISMGWRSADLNGIDGVNTTLPMDRVYKMTDFYDALRFLFQQGVATGAIGDASNPLSVDWTHQLAGTAALAKGFMGVIGMFADMPGELGNRDPNDWVGLDWRAFATADAMRKILEVITNKGKTKAGKRIAPCCAISRLTNELFKTDDGVTGATQVIDGGLSTGPDRVSVTPGFMSLENSELGKMNAGHDGVLTTAFFGVSQWIFDKTGSYYDIQAHSHMGAQPYPYQSEYRNAGSMLFDFNEALYLSRFCYPTPIDTV